uniref:Uncharacterized protein n=1 Tax=Avena sativa TaxID=4498 RepID=A0ACD5Z063_AVESA
MTTGCRRTGPMGSISSAATCRAWHGWISSRFVRLFLRPMGQSTAWTPRAELDELGNGLCDSGKPFLWGVRPSEAQKISQELRDRCMGNGLIVPWCPQIEVLAHKAIGCFLTHCGWNSTKKAIAAGVPMVAMPRSADQPTNAKYVESAWKIGVRMQTNEKGLVCRAEVEGCIRKVMNGERKDEYRSDAGKFFSNAL